MTRSLISVVAMVAFIASGIATASAQHPVDKSTAQRAEKQNKEKQNKEKQNKEEQNKEKPNKATKGADKKNAAHTQKRSSKGADEAANKGNTGLEAKTAREARSKETVEDAERKQGDNGKKAKRGERGPTGQASPGSEMLDKGKSKGKAKAAKHHPDMRIEKELQKHTTRLAKIRRLEDLASKNDNDTLRTKAEMLLKKEQKRHRAKMEMLRDSGNEGVKGRPAAVKAKGKAKGDTERSATKPGKPD